MDSPVGSFIYEQRWKGNTFEKDKVEGIWQKYPRRKIKNHF